MNVFTRCMFIENKKGQSIIRAKIFPLINHINFKNIIYVVKIFQLLGWVFKSQPRQT